MIDPLKQHDPRGVWQFIAIMCIVVASVIVGGAIGYTRPTRELERQHDQINAEWRATIDSLQAEIRENCTNAPAIIVWPDGEIMLMKNIDIGAPY